MGSFNEICAISGLSIPYNTSVKLLFLTQNPYVNSDQRVAHRGLYCYDHWFVRTPPIEGKYNDYGKIEFKENSITNLICQCFDKDIVEKPFGFNQYHTGDVTKTKGIHHFLQAAWQGRLEVKDDYNREKDPPEHFPTWQKIQAILKENNLPIQSESKKNGYNAQPIECGIVCVTFNSYNNNTKKLEIAQSFLKKYDTKIVYKFKDREDLDVCLMVAPKGAYADTSVLYVDSKFKEILNTHPETFRCMPHNKKTLPVLAVMIRDDVWQTYCKIKSNQWYSDTPITVETIIEKLNIFKEKILKRKESPYFILNSDIRDVGCQIPFQTTITTHVETALELPEFTDFDMLLRSTAETFQIEHIMSRLHESWRIPTLGGQENEWSLRSKIFTSFAKIAKKELKIQQEM